jgi:uroporphyrinogen decarboxylase
MTSRERIKAILTGEPYDHFGIYDHYWGETLVEWKKSGYPEDADPGDYFHYDLQGIGGGPDHTPFRDAGETIEESDEWTITKSGWGASYKNWKAKSGVPEHIAFECTTPEKWKKYREQLVDFDPTRFDMDKLREGLEAGRKDDRFGVWSCLFIVETMRHALGDLCMLESTILEPDWVHDIGRVLTDFFIAHYDRAFTEVGKPDGMFIYEDLGFANGLFFSPKAFEALIFPYYKELVGFFHDHNLPVILHTCGGINEAMPLIVDAGFDCLQPMEAKAGCDVVEYAKEYGDRISFMGNMDVTVWNKNNDELTKQEVMGKLTALHELGARYVFHSDHSIPPDISFETYTYAVKLYRDFCETHRCGL